MTGKRGWGGVRRFIWGWARGTAATSQERPLLASQAHAVAQREELEAVERGHRRKVASERRTGSSGGWVVLGGGGLLGRVSVR